MQITHSRCESDSHTKHVHTAMMMDDNDSNQEVAPRQALAAHPGRCVARVDERSVVFVQCVPHTRTRHLNLALRHAEIWDGRQDDVRRCS